MIMLIVLLSTPYLSAQQSFPELTGVDLNDDKVRLPKDVYGKKTLIGLAFSQKAQDELEGWLESVYYDFIDTTTLAALVYDINVYLIISLNSANAGFKDRIFKQLRENVLLEFYPHVIITEASPKELMSELNISDEDNLHLFTLDPLGEITYRTKGRYSESSFDKLSSYLEIE